jgi:peptide/nickel transport system substrate-binding protein
LSDRSTSANSDPVPARFGRRRFLATAAVGAAAVGGVAGLAACGTGGGGLPQGSGGPTGAPKAGGMLRLGAQGGASTDTLDGQNGLTNTDFNRIYQLFDQLMVLDANGQPQPSLAKSITPNGDGTEWTIVIPDGVTTHRGKPFTADDVLFSFNRIMANKYPGVSSLGPVDLGSSKVVNPTTLLVRYHQPFAVLPEMLSSVVFTMVPRDFDPKNPDGTGPFKYQDFTPGVSSTFVRNPNYWRSGLPHLDGVTTTNIAEETSQVNALQSGQVDVVNYLSQGSVAALQAGGIHVNVSKTGGWSPFTMRADQKPFDDVRVRQAFRLIVDRKEMLNQVFGGQGSLGNDMFSMLDKSYPKDLPQREQDIDHAKSLLKAAGADGLTIDLVTTPNGPGMVQAAQVFATQAKKAGVNVNVVQQTTTDYFANSYLKVAFSQDYWQTGTYMFTAGQAYGPGAPFNFCQFHDPEYDSLYTQALAQLDEAKRAELISAMAHIDYDRGGYIIPYFFPVIDAASPKVGGVNESATGYSPGGNDFANFWLT